MVEQQPSFLQHQSEAVVSLSLCMEQHPRILQGFKLQRDDLLPHQAQPHTQPVDQAAAAIKAGHIRGYGTRKSRWKRIDLHTTEIHFFLQLQIYQFKLHIIEQFDVKLYRRRLLDLE